MIKRAKASRIQKLSRKAGYVRRALLLIWEATKGWMIIWGVLLFIQGILPAVTVYLTKVLVDNLSAAIGAGLSWESIRPVVIPAVIMGAIMLLMEVMSGLMGWIRIAQSELVQDHIKNLIHHKAASVDLEFYEKPEESDRMARANSEAGARSLSILQNMGVLLQNLITLVAVAALLIAYSIWLPLILLLSTLPALWVVLRHNSLHHAWWERTTEDRRWASYFDNMLTYSIPAAEVRLFGIAPHYQKAYRLLRKSLRESRLRLMRNQNISQLGAGVSALVVTTATLAWMGSQALRGAASLGDIALFYQAFNQGQKLMRSLLGSVGQLYSDALFLEHLFTFLDLDTKIKNIDSPKPAPDSLSRGIDFKNVSFSYPGSERLALKNFDLHVPAGKTVALVGPNGAGKTTVTKLLCRFYDPVNGSVELDGVDIREFDVEELRRRCTVLFQHPMRFIATVGQNIGIGDLSAPLDQERVERAAQGGGAHEIASQLPNGYDTLLGKQFSGGIDLSGGQWQRVTLARAFYRESPIVILDEPTSFMDSWAETIWLDRFRELVAGRTAIIVTHRFTTAMRADIIYVVDEGRIIESGTHDELLLQKGRYASSWTAQMQAERHVPHAEEQ